MRSRVLRCPLDSHAILFVNYFNRFGIAGLEDWTPAMDQLLDHVVDAYVDAHTDEVSPLLQQLASETQAVTGLVRWSIGKVEGKLLQMLVKMSSAERVVEIGTFTGYSALLVAEALPEDGILITCETNPRYADIAAKYFAKSPHGAKIRLELRPAIDTLSALPADSQHLVFIDADKPSYGVYYEQALRILKPGGIVFVDNAFWRHKIFKTPVTNENAQAIATFNESVRLDQRVEKVMLSVRDGVYLIRKK
jgi:caffeoyl-CoA O-methyltransferase